MSKSQSAPKPDPKLVKAQIQSMGVQDAAIQEILQLSREQGEQMAEMLPLQKEALQFGLDSGRTAYEQSQEDRAYNLGQRDKFTAQTDAMVAEAEAFDTEAEQRRRADAGAAGVGKAYSDAIAANDRDLASMGVVPGGGRQIAIREANMPALAARTVGAANVGREAARVEGRMLRDRAAGALSGAPGAATGSTITGAQLAAGGVNTANAGAGGIYSGYQAATGQQQAAGGLAGNMGANAAGMYGAQAQYKLASDQASSGWMGGAGSLLGGAARIGSLFL